MPAENEAFDDRYSRENDDERRPYQERDEDYDYRDRPRRRRRPAEIEATDFLIPTNVSGYSIAACYFGFVGCFLPFIGLLFALVALPCGIVALRQRKKKPGSYGAVTADMRAVIGVIFASLALLYNIPLILLIIMQNLK